MPGEEGFTATKFRAFLGSHYMCAVNTHHDAGFTFFGPNGRMSRIDFTCTPQSLEILKCMTLTRMLQAIPDTTLRDHVPISTSASCQLPAAAGRISSFKWCTDTVAMALQTGAGRGPFLDEIEEWAI